MLEKKVESHLKKVVKRVGGICEKHVSPGKKGVPDDLITWPDGEMDLAETKRPKGGRLSSSQKRDHAARAKRNRKVYVLWTIEQVDQFMMIKYAHYRDYNPSVRWP